MTLNREVLARDPRARPRDVSRTSAAARCSARDGVVVEALALPNTTEEGPRRRFLVRPADYRTRRARATERAASCSGSTTRIPIIPRGRRSTTWITRGRYFRYVIVSVRERRAAAK